MARRDRRQQWSHGLHESWLDIPVLFVQQVHLDVRLPRPVTQEVVADGPVKLKGENYP